MCARPVPTCALQICGPQALGTLRHADVRLQPRQLVQRPGAARGCVGVWSTPLHNPTCIAPQASVCVGRRWQQGACCCEIVAARIQGRSLVKQNCRASYLDLLGPATQALAGELSLQSFQMVRRGGSRRVSPSSCLQLLEPHAPLGRAHRGGASLWTASWILWWSALSPSHCLFTRYHSVNAGLYFSILGQGPQLRCPAPQGAA